MGLDTCATHPRFCIGRLLPQLPLLTPTALAAVTDGPMLMAYRDGVRTEAAKREMKVSVLDVSVKVRGDIAETTVTGHVRQSGQRDARGSVVLSMPVARW